MEIQRPIVIRRESGQIEKLGEGSISNRTVANRRRISKGLLD